MSTAKSSSLNSFSSRLKSLRADRKKADFARFIGVSPPLYHQWEAGATPTYDKASLIAQKCEVSVEWLLTGIENTAGHRLSKDYDQHKNNNGSCVVSEHKNCEHLVAEVEQLRSELREARAVIRDQAATLAALTSKKNVEDR